MTAYRNFTQDFPTRCLEVLDRAMQQESMDGREVTVLLMTAATAFVTPYERLKPDTERSKHPSRENATTVGKELSAVLAENFSESRFWPICNASWKYAEHVGSLTGDPEQWLPSAGLIALPLSKQVSCVLGHIRIAIAHGIVYTRGNPIGELVFVKSKSQGKPENGCEVLTVTSSDFEYFIRQWVELLRKSAGASRDE